MAPRIPNVNVAAPVISLLSSDDEAPEPAPLKRQDTSTSAKENKASTRSSSKEPTATRLPSRHQKSTSTSSVPSKISKPKKHLDSITIISSSPPPVEHSRAVASTSTSIAYPKIFGALSSDPIFSQSSPPAPASTIIKQTSKLPGPAISKNTLFAQILEDEFSDVDFSPLKNPRQRNSYQEDSATLKSKGKAKAISPPRYRQLDKSTEDLLRKIEESSDNGRPEPITKRRKVERGTLEISESESENEDITPDSPPPSSAPTATQRKTKLTDVEKEARKAEREATKSKKLADKEAQKELKKREKEGRTLQRSESQALSTANKLKTSHVQTVGEMIVNISSDFYASKAGTQLCSFLDVVKVNSHAPFDSPIPGIVKWRRVVTARWNEDEDIFVPIPREIRDESHILAYLDAKEFIPLTNSPQALKDYIRKIKSTYPTCKPIVLIEGLAKLVAKNKSNQSRAYAAQVRNRMREGGREEVVRMDKAAQAVDEDNVEDALLELQVAHGCLVFQTADFMATAESISSYTQHISQIPYKHAKATLNNSTNFCMDVGQVSSGKTVEDTYNKMLQCVHMSTPVVAGAIQAEYPSVQQLFRAFVERGDDVLKDIRIARTGNGRALGPAMSRKIARVLTGRDEWELES
ncbi:hypothetical protein TWF694_006540 [Orbilia ellipsospora]|uniref:ERCC4 domain-containing protein n=1 Tax=Orbilia ellipsospora TaxID=2528407 RepID=A0AAV9XKT9_9PEZI